MKPLCLSGPTLAAGLAPMLALMLSLPAQAVTNATPTAAPLVLMTEMEMGIVERLTSTSIQVGGKTLFLSVATPVYDRDGNRLSAPRMAPGARVKFTLVNDTARQRIKELWLIE